MWKQSQLVATQTHLLEQFPDALVSAVDRADIQAIQGLADNLLRSKPGVQRRVWILKNKLHIVAFVSQCLTTKSKQIDTVHVDLSTCHLYQSGNGQHQGRLTRA